jgi:hypothetical protein
MKKENTENNVNLDVMQYTVSIQSSLDFVLNFLKNQQPRAPTFATIDDALPLARQLQSVRQVCTIIGRCAGVEVQGI